MGSQRWQMEVERALNVEAGKVAARAREQVKMPPHSRSELDAVVRDAYASPGLSRAERQAKMARAHFEYLDGMPEHLPCKPEAEEGAQAFAVGDTITSLVPEHRGSIGEIANPMGDAPGAWLVDFGHTKRVLREDQMKRYSIKVNDDADVIEIHAVDQLTPVGWYSEGGIVGPRPKPLVCDCGHPDSLHSKAPGQGCTHRPYCLCVHPTGQRVPRTRVRL